MNDDPSANDTGGGTIGDAEMDAHLALVQRAIEAPAGDARRDVLIEGLLAFGDRFVATWQELARMAEGDNVFREPAEQAFTLLVGWMKGQDLTSRADERDRRALAGLRLIASRPDLPDLWSYAAEAVLALPEGHPLRDAGTAHEALRTVIQRYREAPGDDVPWVFVAHAVRMAYDERITSDDELIAWEPWTEAIGDRLDPSDALRFWGAIEGFYLDLAGESGRHWLAAADRARAHIDPSALVGEDRSFNSLLLVRRAVVADDQRQAADLLQQALEEGGLSDTVQRRAAVKEARIRLGRGEWDRAIVVLEPRLDGYEHEYVTSVVDDAREAAGRDYVEACATLAFAQARRDEWTAAVAVLERGKCARQRYRRALRRTPAVAELLELETDIYAMGRGIPVAAGAAAARTRDWLADGVTPEAALQERYRQAIPLLDPSAWHAPRFVDIQESLRDGEAALSLGLWASGLLGALISRDSAPCLHTLLRPDITDATLAGVLAATREDAGADGFLIALERNESEDDQRAALDRLLTFLDDTIGRPIASVLEAHGLRRLVVLPHHFLRLAPLWALPSWHGLDVRMAPGAFALMADAAVARLNGHAVLVANPTLDLPLASLEGAVTSARLRDAGLEVRTLSGSKATEDAVTAALDGAALLHVAGHGHASLTDGSRSSLLVSPTWPTTPVADPRGLVTFADTAGAPGVVIDQDEGSPHRKIYLEYARRGTLFAETIGDEIVLAGELWRAGDILVQGTLDGCALAFLCACSSGLGSIEALDEATGLPAALDLAGVRSIVGTGWPVQDALSVLFADEFYAHLLSPTSGGTIDLVSATRRAAATIRDMGRDEALARIEQLASRAPDARARFRLRAFAARVRAGTDRPFAHPFDWGAFYLTGAAELGAPDDPSPR